MDIFQAIASLKTREECEAFFSDLATPAELKAFEERWQIARMLSEGEKSYREISAITGASTTTVGRVARCLQQDNAEGYNSILKRAEG